MDEGHTTATIQDYLDELVAALETSAAGPIVASLRPLCGRLVKVDVWSTATPDQKTQPLISTAGDSISAFPDLNPMSLEDLVPKCPKTLEGRRSKSC